MSEKPNQTESNGYQEFPGGPFKEGNPGGGRIPETEEQKIVKRAQKELVEEYKQKLAESLPEISPVLIAKAIGGDISAIKEINDRVIGRAQNNIDLTTKGESLNQALVKFLDGTKNDNSGDTPGVSEAV